MKTTKALVVSHFVYYPFDNAGTSVNLVNFLRPKVKLIVHIEHPFPESNHQFSYIVTYKNSQIISQKKISNFTKPVWLKYIYDFLLTEIFILLSFSRFDIAVAGENLSALAILPWRKLLLTKKLIYYSVDFVPERFTNKLLNNLYHFIDKLCCQHSDINWVVSKEQITVRKEYITKEHPIYFKVVPIGYPSVDIKLSNPKLKQIKLVFSGGFRQITGPLLILESMPLILKKYPNVKLLLIGGGPEEKAIKEKIKKEGLDKSVEVIKFITNHKELTKLLSSATIGLAPYFPDPKSWSNFSDPSKIKLYLACGLPIITTNVTTMAAVIKKKKVGRIIEYDANALVEAVNYLLHDRKRLQEYHNRAIILSKEFDANIIFQKALTKSKFF